jgi:hypothetical protein
MRSNQEFEGVLLRHKTRNFLSLRLTSHQRQRENEIQFNIPKTYLDKLRYREHQERWATVQLTGQRESLLAGISNLL